MLRGKEAGCFCEGVGVSIVAADGPRSRNQGASAKYRIHGLISAYAYFQNCKEYVLNTQYALNNEMQKLTTPPKPRHLFGSTCT